MSPNWVKVRSDQPADPFPLRGRNRTHVRRNYSSQKCQLESLAVT